MIDDRDLFERAVRRFPPPERSFDRLITRRDRKRRNQRIAAAAVGIAIAVAAVLVGTSVIRSEQRRPAHRIPFSNDGLIALPGGDTLTLLDPQTGVRSQLSLRTGGGGYEVVGFAWSPDGTKFAYTTWQQGTVRVFDLKTNTISTIVPCRASPPDRAGCMLNLAWSPDGSRIALSGSGGLDLIDPDGSNRTTLIGQQGYVGSTTWSPDGASIAFTADLPSSPDRTAIYEVDADGSNLRVLLEQPGFARLAENLRWSPDGTRIAYLVNGDQPPLYPGGPHPLSPQVWIMGPDGSRPSKLFEGGACCAGGSRSGLSWSPDGTKIVFIGTPPGSAYGSNDGRLYALDPDDGNAQVLATHVSLTGPPAWQPAP
jgi:Tol biopolymer transport system component